METDISFLWHWGRTKKVGVGSRFGLGFEGILYNLHNFYVLEIFVLDWGTIDGYAIVIFTDSSALLTWRWTDLLHYRRDKNWGRVGTD